MSDHGLAPEELKRGFDPENVANSKTFEPHGVSRQTAIDYLNTPEGGSYWQRLIESDPKAPLSEIKERAVGQLMSGRELPRMEVLNEPLVKITALGKDVSPHSPFFAREGAFERALASGQRLNDYFGLPVASEAPVYSIDKITPNGPTQVFVSRVAPTSELDGLVTRAGGAEQVLVPNRKLFSTATHVAYIGNDLALHQERVVGKGLGAAVVPLADDAVRGLRPGTLARGAGTVVAAAAVTYDAAATTRDASRLYEQGNATGAESKIIGAVSRNVGALGGVALGAAAGAAVTSETGPGAIVGGVVGGIAGAVGGDRLAHWIDQYRINHQSDRAGNEWTFDPKRPEQGWTRRELDLDAMRYSMGAPVYKPQPLKAGPELADELNFKASNRAIELALSAPPRSQSPYEIPPSAHDRTAPGVLGGNWMRNPETGAWSRTNIEYLDGRVPIRHAEPASPERAAELERQSQAIIARNAANTPAALAANYQAAYAQYGWSRHGQMPEAVNEALRHPNRVVGSDGDLYERNAQGQWTHDGMLWDSRADGNLRRELEATYQAQQARTQPVTTLDPVIVRPDPALTSQPAAPSPQGGSAAPRSGAQRPDDPDHPDHALLEKIRSGVRSLDQQAGKPWDGHSERMSASLLALAAEKKFTSEDDVRVALNRPTAELGAGQLVHVYRVGHANPDPAAHRTHMPMDQALAAPVEDSYRRVDALRQAQLDLVQSEQQQAMARGNPEQGAPRMAV